MSARHRLTLPRPYPPINVAETVEERTGTVRYRFRGARAAGTILITPRAHDPDPLPDTILVQFGDGSRYTTDTDRTDRPLINGVRLLGGVYLTPEEYLSRDNHELHFHRPTGRHTSTSAPEKTNAYASTIVHALVTAWAARPDRDQLTLAAARHTAPTRLNELYRYKINPTQRQIDKLTTELDQYQRQAAELLALASQYHHLYPDT